MGWAEIHGPPTTRPYRINHNPTAPLRTTTYSTHMPTLIGFSHARMSSTDISPNFGPVVMLST